MLWIASRQKPDPWYPWAYERTLAARLRLPAPSLLYPLSEGSGLRCMELVRNNRASFTTGLTRAASGIGPGLLAPGSGNGPLKAIAASADGLPRGTDSDFTAAVWLHAPAMVAGGSASPLMGCMDANSAPGWAIEAEASWRFRVNLGGTSYNPGAAAELTGLTGLILLAFSRRAGVVDLYLNGRRVGGGTGNVSDVTPNAGRTLTIGHRSNNSGSATAFAGVFGQAAVWLQGLSSEQHRALSANPWAYLTRSAGWEDYQLYQQADLSGIPAGGGFGDSHAVPLLRPSGIPAGGGFGHSPLRIVVRPSGIPAGGAFGAAEAVTVNAWPAMTRTEAAISGAAPNPALVRLRLGDQRPTLLVTLQSEAGEAVDLTRSTVRLLIRNQQTGVLLTRLADVVSAAAGTVRHQWQEGDLPDQGGYDLVFHVTTPSGRMVTFPNDHALQLVVTPTLS